MADTLKFTDIERWLADHGYTGRFIVADQSAFRLVPEADGRVFASVDLLSIDEAGQVLIDSEGDALIETVVIPFDCCAHG